MEDLTFIALEIRHHLLLPSIFASSASSLSPSTLVLLIMISAVLLVQSPTSSETTKILSTFAFSPTVKKVQSLSLIRIFTKNLLDLTIYRKQVEVFPT